LAYEKFKGAELTEQFAHTIAAVKSCYSIRNQYAHCHWQDHAYAGLFFTNLEDAAERAEGFEYHFKHVDIPLLELQEAYFIYAMRCLQSLQAEFRFKMGKKKVPHPFPWPKALSQPPKHNPPKEHVPPWLSEDAQKRHIELADAKERGARPRSKKPNPPKLSSKQRRQAAFGRSKRKRS
jgi:hypothetical protein